MTAFANALRNAILDARANRRPPARYTANPPPTRALSATGG